MSNTFLISRSTEDDNYAVWAFDASSKKLLTQVQTDPEATFPSKHHLTAVGGYLLDYSPLDHELDQFHYRLFTFDPENSDPLNGRPTQAGSWDRESFWDYYVYKNCPKGHKVTDLQLIGVTGYVLSFLPTQGRGTFRLWNFDADAGSPGGTNNPIANGMADFDAFPNIDAGHTLLPIGNYVIDWVPSEGTYTVYSFDPQLSNPLSVPTISSGDVPSDEGEVSLVVIREYILAWDPKSKQRDYTLYAFDPKNPFSTVVQKGKLPKEFNADTTLSSVQTKESIDEAKSDEPGTMDFMRKRIKHVVVYVVESRSFDSVVGWLYEKKEAEEINWVPTKGSFKGASESHFNKCDGEKYHQRKFRDGKVSVDWNLDGPKNDPFHGTPDSIHQQWSKGYTAYQAGKHADMKGFLANQGTDSIMAGYTPKQLPVLNGLAENFAVSDEWFCSEAGGTTTNRATLASGSAFNITISYESGSAYTYFPDTPHRQSLWKVLANNGIMDWKIYYSVLWGSAPDLYPYTYHLYLRGQVPSVDSAWPGHVQPIESFKIAAKKGELPAFSFLEPIWYAASGVFTSYHPSGDVIPGEVALNDIYNALKDGKYWDETLLVISFSKGGGMYDHVPAQHLQRAWPNDSNDGYDFDASGARVSTIVVSPLVKKNTVFRSGEDTPFDHTSVAATVLDWFGVPRARWGMGDRVPVAPTFETVLQHDKPRKDAPTLGRSFDKTYPKGAEVDYAPTNDATWSGRSEPSYWTDSTNWGCDEPPTGTATFGESSYTTVRFEKHSQSTVEKIEFTGDAVPYALEFTEVEPKNPTLTISGEGVVNHSRYVQTFAIVATSLEDWQPQLVFTNYATAGGTKVAYSAAPTTPSSASGGIIIFERQSNAGSATFTVRTGSKRPPEGTTRGAEIHFNDQSSAHEARFTLYGTTGSDGDTFGNVVFHNRASAHRSQFTNIGGTVPGGDGGNTQFYDTTSAEYCQIVNRGGSHYDANGGDVAFDGTATAAHANIVNEAAPANGAHGGVTSFNNNPPAMALREGATAGSAVIVNQGANTDDPGTGGHTEFSGAYGAGYADNATIINYGTTRKCSTGGGYTEFSMSGDAAQLWQTSAGYANITNHPGAYEYAQPGYTEFSMYGFEGPTPTGPTADHATIINLGGTSSKAPGGYTKFEQTSTAGQATLIAHAGAHGGYDGTIKFYDTASADEATIQLLGGQLDVRYYDSERLILGELKIEDGTIEVQVGDSTTTVEVKGKLKLVSKTASFYFAASESGFQKGQDYVLMKAEGLKHLKASQFEGNAVWNLEPQFRIDDDELIVSFHEPKKK
jgi:phospholipase C